MTLISDLNATLATTQGTTLTAHASANTKASSWTQISASTPEAGNELLLTVVSSAAGADFLFDIAFGTGGAEVVVAANLFLSSTHGSTVSAYQIKLPFSIPKGTRISARCQCSTGGSAMIIHAHLISASEQAANRSPLQAITAYGADTAISGGVALDPGGTVNTEGTKTQIVASTTNRIRKLFIEIGSQINTAPATARWFLNIYVGAGGGSEKAVVTSLPLRAGTSTTQGGANPAIMEIPCDIPAGSRLSASLQSSINDGTDRLAALVFHGAS